MRYFLLVTKNARHAERGAQINFQFDNVDFNAEQIYHKFSTEVLQIFVDKMRATTITNKKCRKLTVWNNVVPREANESVILADEYLRIHVGDTYRKGGTSIGKNLLRMQAQVAI